jgi:hypothetical protein
MKHLTRNERSPRLPVYWMNRDESRGRGREAQALSRLAKEVCKQARSSTYSGRALRRQVTAWQALGIDVVFLPASFCRDPRTKYGILIGAREFVCGVSKDRNETNVVRLLENFLFPNEALRPELDALMMAKARQDAAGDCRNASHDRFCRPDDDLPFVADDGETMLAHDTGPVEQTDKQQCCSNSSTD